MQTPRQTLDKSQVTFAALPLFATKQYNTIQRQYLPKKYNIDTNICLHGHLHNYYQKVVIQATVISAHLATFEARGYRTEAISCIKLVNICSRTNTK